MEQIKLPYRIGTTLFLVNKFEDLDKIEISIESVKFVGFIQRKNEIYYAVELSDGELECFEDYKFFNELFFNYDSALEQCEKMNIQEGLKA